MIRTWWRMDKEDDLYHQELGHPQTQTLHLQWWRYVPMGQRLFCTAPPPASDEHHVKKPVSGTIQALQVPCTKQSRDCTKWRTQTPNYRCLRWLHSFITQIMVTRKSVDRNRWLPHSWLNSPLRLVENVFESFQRFLPAAIFNESQRHRQLV
jgi:hypothetical protein